jgi:ribosomal protein S18 acetylase RimI-like enzyme
MQGVAVMTIRPFQDKDKDDVRFVCLNSEGPCDLNEADQHFILTTYCDYYIEREPQNCYVAADDTDRAVGYIFCAESFDGFFPVFLRDYASRFSLSQENYRISASHSADLQQKYKSEYPAHLHIDLLPEYQRMGLGHKLVDTLAEHLRSKGIPGVMLTVGTLNKVGQSFYNKYGFSILEVAPGDIAYGLKL